MEKYTDVESLTQFITDEIFKQFKQTPRSWARRTFGSLFRLPTRRFAQVACTFDRYVADYGFREAARRILPYFAQSFEVANVENIPREGPLLVTSNHPGTCDSLVIAATIPRQDLKIVATGVPFMRSLHNAAQNLIYTSVDTHERMMVVRTVIRHLKEGGAVLIFPSGRIDPDPELLREAPTDLGRWSPSIEVMLKHVPQAQVLLTVVSGVLSARWRWHPLVRLLRNDHRERSVAEFLQVIQQMIFPNSLSVNPHLTFSDPLCPADLVQTEHGILNEMIERARCLMEDHMANRQHLLPAQVS